MTLVHSKRVRTDRVSEPCSDRRRANEGLLHRIQAVRQQQGISLRAVARQMATDIRHIRQEEEESTDLKLSDLYRWQEALEVPIAELLVDPEMSLSHPIKERAQLLRLMKTAAAILKGSRSAGTRRLAQVLVDQLVEMMPELEFVSGWHSVGQRRSLDEYGRAAERTLPDDLLYRHQADS